MIGIFENLSELRIFTAGPKLFGVSSVGLAIYIFPSR